MDIKNILVTAAVALVMIVGYNVLVGDNQGVGAGTRFPNGLSADGTAPSAGQVRGTTLTVTGASTLSGALDVTGALTFNGALTSGTATTSTTTISVGKVCYSFTDAGGTVLYGFYRINGTFATTTTSCS